MVTEETLVFRFELPGNKIVAVDPFRVDRLMAVALAGETLQAVIEQSKSPVDALALPAMEKLLEATQLAFNLQPIAVDGTGMNEKAQLRVLKEYLRWKAELKKNIESPAISSAPTGQPSYPCPPSNGTPCGCSEAASAFSAAPR